MTTLEGSMWIAQGRSCPGLAARPLRPTMPPDNLPLQSRVYVLLEEVEKTAETYLGHHLKDAVVTVFAYFDDSQLQDTRDVGVTSGLNVLSIINEPTAVAIAYVLNKNKGAIECNVFIFDLDFVNDQPIGVKSLTEDKLVPLTVNQLLLGHT